MPTFTLTLFWPRVQLACQCVGEGIPGNARPTLKLNFGRQNDHGESLCNGLSSFEGVLNAALWVDGFDLVDCQGY
jgi:hypothetical protein